MLAIYRIERLNFDSFNSVLRLDEFRTPEILEATLSTCELCRAFLLYLNCEVRGKGCDDERHQEDGARPRKYQVAHFSLIVVLRITEDG